MSKQQKQSSQLAALLDSAPAAVAAPLQRGPAAEAPPAPAHPGTAARRAREPAPAVRPNEPEALLQVTVPAHIRKAIDLMRVEEGMTLKAIVLTAFRKLGVKVSDDEIRHGNAKSRKP